MARKQTGDRLLVPEARAADLSSLRSGDPRGSERRASSRPKKSWRARNAGPPPHLPPADHALFSEAELEKTYFTVEALLAHEEMQKFVAWVSKKPPGFYDGTKRSNRRRENDR